MSKTTRREFLATSSTAALAATMANSFGRFAYGEGSEAIRIALIGCGGRGTGAVSQLFNTSGSTRLVAVADAFRGKADASLKHLKEQDASSVDVSEDRIFTGLDAYKHAIDSDCDLVVIATPPGFKPGQIEYAIKRNKHVFMEKPVATDAPGIRRVLAAVEESKRKDRLVGIGLQRRHEPQYMETIQRIHDGAIGEIILARVYWNGGGIWYRDRKPGASEMAFQCDNWYHFNWICGDQIVEQHLHNIDVINWVMGDHPASVVASGGAVWRPSNRLYGNIYDHFFADFVYANGVRMTSHCRQYPNVGRDGNGVRRVNELVVGTKGRSDCRDMGRKGINPYVQEHIDMMASILGTGPYINRAMTVAESTMTAIMGREAAYSGQEITWEMAMNSKQDLTPKDPSLSDKYPIPARPVPGEYKFV